MESKTKESTRGEKLRKRAEFWKGSKVGPRTLQKDGFTCLLCGGKGKWAYLVTKGEHKGLFGETCLGKANLSVPKSTDAGDPTKPYV